MQALANVKSVSDLLQRKRDNADKTFTYIWQQAKQLAEEAGTVTAGLQRLDKK